MSCVVVYEKALTTFVRKQWNAKRILNNVLILKFWHFPRANRQGSDTTMNIEVTKLRNMCEIIC